MAEAGISEEKSDVLKPHVLDFSSSTFDIEDARAQLIEYGVVVISNVISQTDCDTYRGQIDDWLAQFGEGNFPSNINSIIHKYSIAHIEPAWRVRLQTKGIFSLLWGTDKLLTSTDGIAVGRPPETGGIDFGSRVPTEGWHFDQGKNRQGLHAYQGAVYLEEATEMDWCFAVVQKSNHYHNKFFEEFRSGRSEFRKLSKTEMKWLESRHCTAIRIPVPKGGMVLWDSRTVHAGAPPIFGRPNMDRWRYVIFVCQTPAIWATSEDIGIKKEAYNDVRCSRHWASNSVGNFKTSRSQYDITEVPEIARTDEAKLLAGVKSYDFGDGAPVGPYKITWTGSNYK